MLDSSHWYDIHGDSHHTIIGKNGVERPTTLRDAKKLNLLPSVTTIFKCLAKPELDKWKQRQVLMASLTLSRREEEGDEEFCERIMDDAFKQVDDAADLGTRVHAALENHFQGMAYDPSLSSYVETVEKWVKDNQIQFLDHELRVVCPEVGFAGTTDAIIMVPPYGNRVGVLDFKTRKSRPQYAMTPWQTEPMQIAAYGYTQRATFGVNVFISTTEPGRIEDAWYEPDQMDQEFKAFRHVCKIWQHFNKYVPKFD